MKYEVNSMFSITDEVAIITGASRGVGKEVAFAMASLGAKVALLSVSATNLYETVSEFRKKGFDVLGVPTDTTNKGNVQAMAKQVAEHFGKIDILVNFAGVRHLDEAISFAESKWNWVMDINLKGTFLICQAVGEYMIQQEKGRIVNISSVYGILGRSKDVAYAPSNAAINQLTRSLAVEWAKYNINVNAVAPTPIGGKSVNEQIRKDEKLYNQIVSRIPKGRFCEPHWLIGPIVFLCSPCSEFVTGHVLYVDGGRTIN